MVFRGFVFESGSHTRSLSFLRSNRPEAGLLTFPTCDHINYRQTQKFAGNADVMSVVRVAAEVTGSKVAFKGYQRKQDENRFG